MKLLVVGGGGREHAIIKKLRENPEAETIYALPGNGGIAADAVCVPEIGTKDIPAIVAFAKAHAIDFAVVAPDDPLALGCVDRLHEAGIPCFGPDAKAARIEASKVFSKNLMRKYGIPTAAYQVFHDSAAALAYLKTASYPIVIKADGLALGKGVLIPQSLAEAEAAVKTIMEDKAFGDSGNEIVIEEFLTGPEVSVLAFTDGTAIAPMVSSMDHKRAGDGDTGLNTGGMGTVAPNPCYTPEIAQVCMDTIFLPTLAAMRAEGCPFKGCLYFGLMLTPRRPQGHRVQLPLRRPGDPGGPAPAENGSFDRDAGRGERDPEPAPSGVARQRRRLCDPGLRRLSQSLRKGQDHHLPRRVPGQCHLLPRRRQAGKRNAGHQRRSGAGHHRRSAHSEGGPAGRLRRN